MKEVKWGEMISLSPRSFSGLIYNAFLLGPRLFDQIAYYSLFRKWKMPPTRLKGLGHAILGNFV